MSSAHGGQNLGFINTIPVLKLSDVYFEFDDKSAPLVSNRGHSPVSSSANMTPIYDSELKTNVGYFESSTTNLILNPDFSLGTDTSATNWGSYTGITGITRSNLNYASQIGSYTVVCSVDGTSSTPRFKGINFDVTRGNTYRATAYIASTTTTKRFFMGMKYFTSAGSEVATSAESYESFPTKEYKTHVLTGTFSVPTADTTLTKAGITIGLRDTPAVTDKFMLSGVIVTDGAVRKTFINGTRTGMFASYDSSVFCPSEFTVNMMIRIDDVLTERVLLEVGSTNSNVLSKFSITIDTSNILRVWVNGTGYGLVTNFPRNQWAMVTVVYNQNKNFIAYLNGNRYSETGNNTTAPNILQDDTINIGGRYYGNLNGRISRVLISKTAASDADIKNWYLARGRFFDPYNINSTYYV